MWEIAWGMTARNLRGFTFSLTKPKTPNHKNLLPKPNQTMPTELYFATKNIGKLHSLQQALPKVKILQAKLNLPEPRSDNLKLIAKQKVSQAFNKLKKPVLANDAGFYIQSLQGFPKAFVNFTLETIGIQGLLTLTKDKPKQCEFRQVLAYKDQTLKQPLYFESTARGTLPNRPRGKTKKQQWSDLFKIFIPEGETKTLAEMSEEEFNTWRKNRTEPTAMKQFAEWYNSREQC